MFKIKVFSLLFVLVLFTASCSEYQKALNKGTIEEQYQMATKMYDAQKFGKAIQLFEKITPSYRGKPQMERIQFMVAQSHYNTKLYSLAAYYFDQFVKNYPKSSKIEEAAFLSALSYYKASPVYSLDQKDTFEAITALQNFIYAYPNSEKVAEANKYIKELNTKLEKKSFEIARQYFHMEDYIAAIVAFDNLLADFLGTSFREEAMYLKFKSAYFLGMNSIFSKKEARLNDAIKFHERFKKSFPESDYLQETNSLIPAIEKELQSHLALKNQTNGL